MTSTPTVCCPCNLHKAGEDRNHLLEDCPHHKPPTESGWQERFEKQFVNSMFSGVLPKHRDGGARLRKDLESFIAETLCLRDEEIKQNLLAIADAGEYEDMRREITRFFDAYGK